MSSTSTTNKRVHVINIPVNHVIQCDLAVKNLNNTEANSFQDLCIRIQTNTKLVDALMDFRKSFTNLNDRLYSSAISIISVSLTASTSSTASISSTASTSSTANASSNVVSNINTTDSNT